MSNELALTFEAMQVRMVIIDGAPWWVLVDVCHILEHSNPSMAAKALDDDEKMTLSIVEGQGGPGIAPTNTIISEPGLYKLLQRSNKPQAKRFDRWNRHEVLPEIRKTGSYHGALPTLTEFGHLLDTKLEPVHRGMAQMRDEIAEVKGNVVFLSKRVDDMAPRHNFTKNTQRIWICVVVEHNSGKCPCCRKVKIIHDGRKIEGVAQDDHFNGRERNTPQDGWLVCVGCNLKLRDNAEYKEGAKPHFRVFQDNLMLMFGTARKQSARKHSKTAHDKKQLNLFN